MGKINFKIGDGAGKVALSPTKNPVEVGADAPLFVIAGPCVIESESLCLDIAGRLVKISQRTEVPMVFKASFDKANRSSISSFRGPGLEKGLDILAAADTTILSLILPLTWMANSISFSLIRALSYLGQGS
ncbi:unnamed protein product [marine sediment metagenome]|uniref:3-deoxy-8-phosphooctulonate synthase n=1 Tax=marine sediment metagenome TaxID=412755 RepID=X1CCJ6_9ZZZZ